MEFNAAFIFKLRDYFPFIANYATNVEVNNLGEMVEFLEFHLWHRCSSQQRYWLLERNMPIAFETLYE
jgi:hypothetical protein